MRVCGDNFAVSSEQGLYISVWNWKSGEHLSDFMALLQTPVFTFLDEYHILFPGSTADGLYVYDIRAMPPMNTRKQRVKGTHSFEIPVSQLWGHERVCSITLDCNSLATGADTAPGGLFYTDPHDRVVSLRITAELNPTGGHANRRPDYLEMHVHAHSLLRLTQALPAPPNACVVVPWSAWGPAAVRVVAPRLDDSDVVYMCPSQSRFSGCGMRIVSAPSVRSDGTSRVTVTDYHPARVFRTSRRQEVVRHTYTTPTEIEAELWQERGVSNAGRGNPSAQDGVYSNLRPERLPLLTFFGTHAEFAMKMIKNLFLFGWYSPPQELEKAPITHVLQIVAEKMQYFEKDISLPKEFQLNASQPVFNVLCEDAVMFYTLVPGSNTIRLAHWYTF
jgi:hypothetical protein